MSRSLLLCMGISILLNGCSSRDAATIHTIAIQPIGPCDSSGLQFIRQETSAFFHRPVILLPNIDMPHSFLNLSKGQRYSADSIIRYLAKNTNDTITQIVGFTHKDIFTTDKDATGKIREPKEKYAVWGIFGLGDCPGKASVVSDYRLQTSDPKKFQHRLRTVILHEIGHNIGLPHCPHPHCIMNDANEKIATVDNSADDYCQACRRKAGLPIP